jgi:hypothetical protein
MVTERLYSFTKESLRYPIDNVIEGTYRILDQTPRAIEHMDAMKSIQLSEGERHAFAAAAKELRWNSEEMAVDNGDLLRPRRAADHSNDVWATFNVLQEKIIKGGSYVRNVESNRSQRAREVKSVSENVRLNKALWTLAEEMLKLKTA